jgi:hypothetical protein
LAVLWIANALAVSCGSRGAGTIPTPPLSGSETLIGRVLTNQTGEPVPGVSLTVTASGQTTLVSDSGGNFVIAGVPIGRVFYAASRPGYLTHRSELSVPTSGPVTLDLIKEEPPFSLSFYREFARNAREAATTLVPINPWTRAPKFYLKTLTEDTGEEVRPEVIDGIRRIAYGSVPDLTGGRFVVAQFETGPTGRPSETGWVNVLLYAHGTSIGAAGTATVGSNGGTIRLIYDPARCLICLPECPSFTEWSMDHEIVHAMGFYHTSGDGSDFHSGDGCPGSGRPAIVQYHAKIMYSRPPGNMDPDTDPPGFVASLASSTAPAPRLTVTCPLPPGWRPK